MNHVCMDKPIYVTKRKGPAPRLQGAYQINVNIEEKHRIAMKIYNRRQPEMLPASVIVRRALTSFFADITDQEIQAEIERERSAGSRTEDI